jgi:DNA/RNA-binding domain of Phe-tRNA-synthetase-like protein
MKIVLGERWPAIHPRAGVGILIMTGLVNPKSDNTIELSKRALEANLRDRFSTGGKPAIRALPAMLAYSTYYRKFNKSYHVQLQTESVALQGKSLPSVSSLVDTMFMAELRNGLLTAGHDLNALHEPITIDAALGTESYTMMNGKQQTLKAGDMFMRDVEGVISCVLSGSDALTQIRPDTTSAMFAVYAPEGIAEHDVTRHLTEIQESIKRFSPESQTSLLDTYGF